MKLIVLFITVVAVAVPAFAQSQGSMPRMQSSCAPPGQWVPRTGPSGPYWNCEATFIPSAPSPVVVYPPVVVYQPAPVYVPVYQVPDSAAAIRFWLATGVNPLVSQVFPVAPCFGSCVSVSVGATFPIGGGHRHHRRR